MAKKLLIIAALALTLSACGESESADDTTSRPDDTADHATVDDISDQGTTDDGDDSSDSTDGADDGRKPIGESFVATKDGGGSLEITLTAYEPGSAAAEYEGLVPDGEELHIAYFTVKNIGDQDQDAIIYDNYLVDEDNEMVHEQTINLEGCQSFNDWQPHPGAGRIGGGLCGIHHRARLRAHRTDGDRLRGLRRADLDPLTPPLAPPRTQTPAHRP